MNKTDFSIIIIELHYCTVASYTHVAIAKYYYHNIVMPQY